MQIKDIEGSFRNVRALIDPGSELSFIEEGLVKTLNLNRKSASIPLLGIGGTYSGRTKGVTNVQLHSIHDSSVYFQLQAFILARLTFELPSFKLTRNSWSHMDGLQLADPDFDKPGPIGIIIGADSYGQIIKPELIRGDPLSPIAQSTLFGWTVLGPASAHTTNEAQIFHCAIDSDLQDLLTRFWQQEEVTASNAKPLKRDECEEHFMSTFTRDNNGRYIVKLPLKSSVTTLGDSFSTALRYLEQLKRKFDKNPVYRELYVEFLQEYESLGHMSPVPDSQINVVPVFYLPHHGVMREHSQTTKLRVVFNGSSPSSSGKSLNDILHAGEKLQADIFDVLLWFRLHRYVFSTDVTKMYRQIMINPDDQNLQRILWYDSNGQVRPYKLTTVTYGLNCAPFLALRVLKQLIDDEGYRFPKAIPALTKGRYVDDIFGGAESVEELKETINHLQQLCMAGGFPLQKWNSNNRDLLTQLSLTGDSKASTVELNSSRVRVLGLSWQPDRDVFTFTSLPSQKHTVTKRTVLSEVAQIYDPLGFISPVIIRAKILIQELWLAKIDWDKPLPTELQNRWINFRRELPALDELSIPRWIHTSSKITSLEIHGFSDASQLAMAAVVYVRITTETNNVKTILVCAKTKVAPLKRLTIPRLELNAALLLSRLVANVQRTLNLAEDSIFLWTDSSVALCWISADPARWREYVCNRVTAIQTLIPSATWRFVPGSENPADCASRGLKVRQLKQHQLWWSGPSWLRQSSDSWPTAIISPSIKTDMEEKSRSIFSLSRHPEILSWDLLYRYSSLTRLLRITAVCRRVIKRLKGAQSSFSASPLTPSELQQSCQFWVRHIQNIHFHREIEILKKGEQLSKSSSLTKLTPFIDSTGLLRVGGRLQKADLPYDEKHPFILPRMSKFTTLVIAEAHLKTLHGGTQLTLAYTRLQYWIVGGRAPIRSFILRCVRCARHRQNRAKQLMGQLPASRVSPARPFSNNGVDYAGPISIKTWRGRAAKVYKGYLAIFVCFSTSAVHIEVVTDYTSAAFIAAYKRFTARRGICTTLFSDCGTNFVGADKELRQMFSVASKELKKITGSLTNQGTEWRFNPPSAPHFGGKWEAAVKSTKHHLCRVIGETILTYEELSTIMAQIEAVLNSRPLCPMSEDADDYTALTPGHFLIGEAPIAVPEPTLIEVPTNRLSRWQLVQQKVEQFWKRWKAECLQRYQAVSKWHHPSTEVKEGALVLLTDERYPPTKWPLARVVQLHPGTDGLVRVVTLRTQSGTFKRPITKLCVLPVDPESYTFGNSVPEGGRNNVGKG